MKKVNIFLGIGIGIIIIIGGWMIFSQEEIIPEEKEVFQEQEKIKKEVVLVIDDGEKEPKTFETEFNQGMTAFGLLKEKVEELGLILRTKTYDIGVLIEAIGDKENGQDGKYWMYYVNGEMPMVAADKKEVKPGDKIEFKFEKSPF